MGLCVFQSTIHTLLELAGNAKLRCLGIGKRLVRF